MVLLLPSYFSTLLLLLLTTSSTSNPTPTSTSTSPPPNLAQANPGLSIRLLQHRKALARRSDPLAVKAWALREKSRVNTKYSKEMDGDQTLVRNRKRAEGRLEGRVFPTAGVPGSSSSTSSGTGTASGTATSTRSANSSQPTIPVGFVSTFNFEADLEYFAPVGVGVPPQKMNVILDTGSADLWIASSNCTSLTGCPVGLSTFNSSLSTSSINASEPFNVRYGSGSASGNIMNDFVGFAGFNVSGQGYALCDVVSPGLLEGNVSGLMGLGWQTLAASGQTPFWQNLFQAGVLPFPGFAFHLLRSSDTSQNSVTEGGSVTFGYLNSTLYSSSINYIPLPSGQASYWLIPIDSVAVNGTNSTGLAVTAGGSGPVQGSVVAIDTGTTLIGGPPDVIANIYSMIPGALAATGDHVGYYSYPCNATVNITFGFGGMTYKMSPADFNLGGYGVSATNVSTCLGAFFDLSFSSTSKISWVIGAAFLKNVYSVFQANPPSVGFALLSPNYTSSYGYNQSQPHGNTTNIPNGIYGPSGVPLPPSAPTSANDVTTAIQAGQTPTKSPLPGAAARMSWGGEGWQKWIVIGTTVAVAVLGGGVVVGC